MKKERKKRQTKEGVVMKSCSCKGRVRRLQRLQEAVCLRDKWLEAFPCRLSR